MAKSKVRYILVSALNVNGERRPIIEDDIVDAPGRVPELMAKVVLNLIKSGECKATQMLVISVPLGDNEKELAGCFRPQPLKTIMGIDFTRLV